MITQNEIIRIKNSVVAIGLRSKDSKDPISIHGSGFLVDQEGYIVTASHVIQGCIDKQKSLEEEGTETWLAIFSYREEGNEGEFRHICNTITGYGFMVIQPTRGSEGLDLDVAICKLKDPEPNHEFLEISNKREHKVFDEIIVCGYPGGKSSIDYRDRELPILTSPIIQPGIISKFFPADNSPIKDAIATNIIGTGGSSGSPIIQVSDGKVIGVTQWVISPGVFLFKDKKKQSGFSNIGLMCGVINPTLEGITDSITQMKSGSTKIKFKSQSSNMNYL